MRDIFLIALTALTAFSTSSVFAQQSPEQKQARPAASLLLRPRVSANPCAEYGPGFVRVEGWSTSVRIGGNLDVGVGLSR